MVETTVADGVLQVLAPGTRWLATGVDGGYRDRDAVYNVTVPDGFDRRDPTAYAAQRRREAGFDRPGVSLLTGVAQHHARGARLGPVSVVATAGLSNPAALPLDPDTTRDYALDDSERDAGDTTRDHAPDDPERDPAETSDRRADSGPDDGPPVGTVNVVARTIRALDDGALATLLATVTEAKTATLTGAVGFTGTTSDAVVVGCDPDGDPASFAGSASPVGAAARACVREALRAALSASYADEDPPTSVADASHGVVTDDSATVFEP